VQLIDIRNEVYACGFDPGLYTQTRVNQFINNGYLNVVRRVNYYIDESTDDFPTITGTSLYPLPANFVKVRSLHDTGRDVEMVACGLRQIDQSYNTTGAPAYYAMDGANLHLWPAPDNIYPLEIRYWKMPLALTADTDVPTIPPDYHSMLVYWAVAECYSADDDPTTAQQWQARYDRWLAEFAADMKFPDDDVNTQAADMWTGTPALGNRGWSVFGTDWGF
jgi:hypothetical protein